MKQYHEEARGRSFGAFADEYDRHRPAYAPALLDELAALRPRGVVDVGCGSGALAAGLTGRGLDVLGVDPDERMAARARARGVTVEVSPFETWDDGGRRFDLLVCGAAWHWIDPESGIPAAARVLRPGGLLVRCWTFDMPEEPLATAIDNVYAELAPGCTRYVMLPPDNWAEMDPLRQSDAFDDLGTRIYPSERTFSADGWVQMASTFSDHQRLEPERLARLQAGLRAAIDGAGGTVHSRGGSLAHWARRR